MDKMSWSSSFRSSWGLILQKFISVTLNVTFLSFWGFFMAILVNFHLEGTFVATSDSMTVNDLWHSRTSLATRSNTCRKNWKHQQLTATALSMSTSTTSLITAACISEIDSSINSSRAATNSLLSFSLRKNQNVLFLYMEIKLNYCLFYCKNSNFLHLSIFCTTMWPCNMRLHSFATVPVLKSPALTVGKTLFSHLNLCSTTVPDASFIFLCAGILSVKSRK